MSSLCALGLVVCSAAFDVMTFPLPTPDAAFFAAKVEPTGSAEVVLLEGGRLTIYMDADPASPVSLELRPDTTAVDIADINGDGSSEVIAIAGESILRYNLPQPATPGGAELFRLRTQFSAHAPAPFVQMLVVLHEGVPVLALPTETKLELRSANGTLVESLPLANDAGSSTAYGNPFSRRSANPPQVGPPGALEVRISRAVSSVVLQPGEAPADLEGMLRRRGTARQMVEAAALSPETWPWFPLRRDSNAQDRVLYAAADDRFRDILIRVRTPQILPESGEPGLKAGPPRRYPGMLVRRDRQQPDFNGDGYADLMLWLPSEPSASVNSLTRAAVRGQWPIVLLVHLFVPGNNRFDPSPAAQLNMDCPLGWYLESPTEAPLANVVFADFNGDTRSDFACSTSDNAFGVWLFSEKGFGATPDFQRSFPEPLGEVVFVNDLRERSHAAVALRGDKNAYVLVPGDSLPSFPPPIQAPAQPALAPPAGVGTPSALP